jgi:cytochrome c oxidase assembly factor CtaG
MNPLLAALLSSWEWRIEIILVLVMLGALYLRGWSRLRRITGQRPSEQRSNPRPPLAATWKPVAYLSGLVLVAVALMSPVDVLASQLFSMHMIQHLLLMMFAVPLLLIATPFPALMWGLPKGLRRTVGGALNQESGLRQLLTKITAPGVVWFVYVAVYVGWHDPGMYNLALRNDFVHDLEHLSFFAIAMLYWWHVTGVGPRFHRTFGSGKRLMYVVAAVPASMFTGIAIAFSSQPIYQHYTTVPRFYGLSVLDDQILAGVIMWIPGSMMFLLAGLILLGRIVQVEANKPPDPNPAWQVDERAVTGR